MKKQFAFIGLGAFNRQILKELGEIDCEILLLDKNREVIEQYKDQADAVYIADASQKTTITRLIPPQVDAVLIDLEQRTESSVLATNHLKKQGIRNIIVKAETEEHGEILELVGAHRVILPQREAARQIAPLLLTSRLFTFLPLGHDLVIAEVQVPELYENRPSGELTLKNPGIKLLAVRNKREKYEFHNLPAERILNKEDILLIAGEEKEVLAFGVPQEKQIFGRSFLRLFKNFMNTDSPD